MATFALACEGITDQIVIENILCGFYDDYDDLDEEIQPLQPPYDATTQKQKEGEFGGWEMLFNYLSEKRFRDDVLNSQYVIIQVDTDTSEHKNFNVSQQHKEKIIFAISVHSLECWILPLYKTTKNEKISGCFAALKRESKKIKTEKTYKCYDRLSSPLLKHKKLLKIAAKNNSFQVFIDTLPSDI